MDKHWRPRAVALPLLPRAVENATLSSRRGICAGCISFYCRWQLLSAPTPGPNEAAGDMAAVAAGVGVVSMAAPPVGDSAVAMAAEASAVATEVFEAAMVAGDMVTVTATVAVGGMGLASG